MAIVGWEHFEHAADIGVRGFGGTIATAFEQVALATSAAVTDPSALNPRASVRVHCSAEECQSEGRGSARLGHRIAKDIERTHVDHLGRSKMSPGNGFGEI